jgi:hypothetical protein
MHEHARYRHGPRRNNWHSFFVRAQTGQGVEVLSVCFFNCMMAPKARVALTLVLDPENNTNTQLLLPFPRAGLASTLKGVLLRLRNVVMDFFKVFFYFKIY